MKINISDLLKLFDIVLLEKIIKVVKYNII